MQDADARLEKLHKRFFERVFTKKENELLQENPQANTWKLWAAKEAAYKYIVQKYGKTTFAHRLFEVADDFSFVGYLHEKQNLLSANDDKNEKKNRQEKIPVKIFQKEDFVYALANESFFDSNKNIYANSYICDTTTWKKAKQEKEVKEIISSLQKKYPQKTNELSLAIRTMTIFILSRITSINSKKIFIENLNIPHTHIPAAFVVLEKKERLPFTLSFTHHGDFFALYLASYQEHSMTMPQEFLNPSTLL